MTKLTTHVLDVYSGRPGKGIKVDLYYYKNNDQKSKINTIILNNDGRSDQALIEGENFKEGKYELIFFIGDYFCIYQLAQSNASKSKRRIYNVA